MNDTTQPGTDRPRHYHLFSTMVIYFQDGREKRKFLNSVSPGTDSFVTAMDIARVQHQVQVRFRKEFDPKATFKIADVYIQAISYLGQMTDAQFDAGFTAATGKAAETASKAEPDPDTETEDAA